MSDKDDHVSVNDNDEVRGNSSQESARDITDRLLQSPSALEALGRGLLPALSPLMSQSGPSGSRVSQVSRNNPISMHAPQPFNPPWYPPFPMYGPPSYGNPFPYPMMGGYPYGQQDRSGHGAQSQSKSSLPGNPGCAPHTSTSSQEDGGGLLASSNLDEQEEDDDEGSWRSLVDPFLSQEEQNSLDPETSEQGDPDMEAEITDIPEDLPAKLVEFLSVAFKKPMSADRRKKLVTKYPRPSLVQTTPPSVDKSMLALIQKRKNIISHDRFLAKLQRLASDAIGPILYLLKELQSGKGVPQDKAISALQTSLCFTGNAFAALSVERRRSILRQLNQQLTPLADEEFKNTGKLFGDDFGKRAKERMDAIRSLSRSSSVFFRLGDPPTQNRFKGQGGRGKGQASRFTPYDKTRGSRWGKTNPQ